MRKRFFNYSLYIVLLGIVLSSIGFYITYNLFYPGLMSPDSLDQYSQAKANKYSDWHPPIMAGLWHLLLTFCDGPQPMLILQLLLLWGSFLIIFIIYSKHFPAFFILIPLVFNSIFILNFAGNIWKDVHLALAWLFATLLIANAFISGRRPRWWEAALSMLLICYGTWVRSNALPGTLPLAAFWIIALFGRPATVREWLYLGAKSAGICIVILAAQVLLTKKVLNAYPTNIEYKLYLHDLQGISKETKQIYFPAFIKAYPGFDSLYLLQNYRYTTFDHIWWNGEGKDLVPKVVSAPQVKETRNYWLKQIINNPAAYLKNKWIGYLNFLRIERSKTRLEIFYPHIHPNEYGFVFDPDDDFYKFMERVQDNSDSMYFEPWFWGILNVILPFLALFFFRRSKIFLPVIALSFSSFLYLAFEFFAFPADTEFRYFYWNVLAVTTSFLLVAGLTLQTIQMRLLKIRKKGKTPDLPVS